MFALLSFTVLVFE